MSDPTVPGPTDPFEMMRRMWSQTAMPVPGLNVPHLPSMMMPTFSVAELDKRISDLKSVENWLTLNLNVLRMTIQGMEMQKATLSALRAMQPTAPGPATGEGTGPLPSAADAWWAMFQQVTGQKPGGGPQEK
jgi:hypothetical protein